MATERDKKDKAMDKTFDVRRAHKILARLGKHPLLSKEQENLLRSLLPELPKQKTLTELRLEVWDAWIGADGNEWADDAFGDLETWLHELHEQLQELEHNAKPAKPAHTPALPAGMRIADHKEYGRGVVSPKADVEEDYLVFIVDESYITGGRSVWLRSDELTFIDSEPANPAHPEFLETEADYENAPEGTVVAADGGISPIVKDSVWPMRMSRSVRRRVLRWGWGNE